MGEDQGQRRLADTGHPGNGCHRRLVPTSAENLKGAGDLGAAAYERLGACWQFMPPDADGQRPTVRQPLPGPQGLDHLAAPPRNRCAPAQGGCGACHCRRSPMAAYSLRNRPRGQEPPARMNPLTGWRPCAWGRSRRWYNITVGGSQVGLRLPPKAAPERPARRRGRPRGGQEPNAALSSSGYSR